jgi:hypothetical protein
MLLYGDFPYDPNERRAFAERRLQRALAAEYPHVFDDDDIRIALTQPRNHYFEWLGAIRLYLDVGYISLVEKYQFRRHQRKHVIFRNTVPAEVYDLVARRGFFGARQGPDLFVYRPDGADWFFCEVKGGPDHVRDSQAVFWGQIERVSHRPVMLIHFHEAKHSLTASGSGGG